MRVREVVELQMRSARAYANPFADVALDVRFTGPSGISVVVPGFYDGDGTWRVRFNPPEAGPWRWRATTAPQDPELNASGRFDVEPGGGGRGFLRTEPRTGWGFEFESGEPVWVFGDTAYNLFGFAHCGLEVDGFLRRRAEQGFNLLRVRLSVSPTSDSQETRPSISDEWHTRSCWPWGGDRDEPEFDRFNLDWFRTVDRVVGECERLGMGLEMIAEGWGSQFPFNRRQDFTTEWEELWLRYLIARYDAYSCVWFWTPLNEYEYYPHGRWRYAPLADRWAMRVSRWIKQTATHGHIVSAHHAHAEPPFADRFAADPDAIDTVMIQCWGTIGESDGWLAAGIEEQLERILAGWRGSAVLSEYGYELNPSLPLSDPPDFHRWCDVHHTRRGAWRAAFSGYGIVHGFENTWGPYAILDKDQDGVAQLLVLRHFLHRVVPFASVRPAPELVVAAQWPEGCAPLALADAERRLIAVYLPAGGEVRLHLPRQDYHASWFDPRTAELTDAGTGPLFSAPTATATRDSDRVLVLS
ncbi:MAG TPA: DUF5060 domain-containing protein [Candidatus Limnocylindrales bacterium]